MMKKIYIFGAGSLGKYVYELMKEDGIFGFIDNSEEKQKQGFMGKKVFALNEVLEKKEEIFVIIAVAERHYREVYQQLCKAGFSASRRLDLLPHCDICNP